MPDGVVPELKSKMNVLVQGIGDRSEYIIQGIRSCDLGNTVQEAKKLQDGLHVEESHQTAERRFHVQ